MQHTEHEKPFHHFSNSHFGVWGFSKGLLDCFSKHEGPNSTAGGYSQRDEMTYYVKTQCQSSSAKSLSGLIAIKTGRFS